MELGLRCRKIDGVGTEVYENRWSSDTNIKMICGVGTWNYIRIEEVRTLMYMD